MGKDPTAAAPQHFPPGAAAGAAQGTCEEATLRESPRALVGLGGAVGGSGSPRAEGDAEPDPFSPPREAQSFPRRRRGLEVKGTPCSPAA